MPIPEKATVKVQDSSAKVVGADRVLAVLIELSMHVDGVSLDDLTISLGMSKPTVHRALVTLQKTGLANKTGRGYYVLGDEFLRIANRFQEHRPEALRFEPLLRQLATRFGETAHYAVLDGSEIVYRAKVDAPQGAVHLNSVIGGRNPAYCTAVGKLLLSYTIEDMSELRKWLGSEKLVKRTEHTITTQKELLADLRVSKTREYGIDDQENEMGINCFAIPIFTHDSMVPTGAISISGLAFRTPVKDLVKAKLEIQTIVNEFLFSS